jgi:hypothetical protein
MILQEMWVAGFDWDFQIIGEIAEKAKRWFEELAELENI